MQKTPAPLNIDEYLAVLPSEVRQVLQQLREIIKSVAPEAEEVISYQMPAFRYHGILVYFAAFKNHCSLFAANASLMETMKDELKSFKTSKGTIQFTVENPLPESLIIKIVKARMKENEAKTLAKKAKKLAK